MSNRLWIKRALGKKEPTYEERTRKWKRVPRAPITVACSQCGQKIGTCIHSPVPKKEP